MNRLDVCILMHFIWLSQPEMQVKFCVKLTKLLDNAVQVFYILLIFYLLVVSVMEKEMWKSPAIIVDFSISSCSYIGVCLMYFKAIKDYKHLGL